jgi:methionine sulfoxide reductase catalytic subunit
VLAGFARKRLVVDVFVRVMLQGPEIFRHGETKHRKNVANANPRDPAPPPLHSDNALTRIVNERAVYDGPMAKLPKEPLGSEITPPDVYLRRREWLKKAGLFTATAGIWGGGLSALASRGSAAPPPAPPPIPPQEAWKGIARGGPFDAPGDKTPFEDVTTYNNFYELGLSKSAPANNADRLKTEPWTVEIVGHVKHQKKVDLGELIGRFGLEERIYRMRCVEAWSMVIPWVGFPVKKLIDHVEPLSNAKFVYFKTLLDMDQLPGQRRDILPWPYVEALRIDEAANPLTMLAVGLYGAPLLGQNGAPLRLVVPWKYGFKGAKSIVEIGFTDRQPVTTWPRVAGREYGFYANVNPEVPHPRWSQATERRIPGTGRIPTAKFNGYGEQVAQLYDGMDLSRHF